MGPRHVIGVDGGGSQTVGLLADVEGHVLARAVTGPSNIHTVGLETAADHIRQLLNILWTAPPFPANEPMAVRTSRCEAICLGIAGLGRPDDRERLRAALRADELPGRLLLTHDAHIALMAGTNGVPGILLVCGTGSIAFGIDAEGRHARAGGWGPLLADEGSGYAIALAGLRTVMRSVDGREGATQLTSCLLNALDLRAPEQLVRWTHEASREQIAALVPQVFAAAEAGDPLAERILEEAVQELVGLVEAVARQLSPSVTRVVLSGGVFQGQPGFVERLRRRLPDFQVSRLDREPACGALLLALSQKGNA